MRAVVPELAGKLGAAMGRPLTAQESSSLAIAAAAIAAALWEAMALGPDALGAPSLRQQLATMLLSALSERP